MTVSTTLVTGADAAIREAAIAALIDPKLNTGLILEGLSDGMDRFAGFANTANIHVVRIAPGCLCCTGNLTMRVTLNRMLRRHPERLYISLITSTHLSQIQQFLSQAPYDKLLTLTDVLTCDDAALRDKNR